MDSWAAWLPGQTQEAGQGKERTLGPTRCAVWLASGDQVRSAKCYALPPCKENPKTLAEAGGCWWTFSEVGYRSKGGNHEKNLTRVLKRTKDVCPDRIVIMRKGPLLYEKR